MQKTEFEGICLNVPDDVYLPSDDSFLLAEASVSLKGKILELGCGSGIVSLFNAKANPQNTVFGVDINPSAIASANENAKLNSIGNTTFVESDLFDAIPDASFDAILFNPPYLPTPDDEKIRGKLNAAFDGGKNGRDTLGRFFDQLESHIHQGTRVLILHSSLNNPDKTFEQMESLGLKTEKVCEKSFFFEKLMVLKGTKS